MNNTHGDILYRPSTKTPVNESTSNDLLYRLKPEDTTGGLASQAHNNHPPRGEVGWICPICGRGLAPSTSYCPCNLTRNITYVGDSLTAHGKAIDCNSTPPEAYYTTTNISM